MKTRAEYRDWLHRYMVEVDNTRPDSDHCRKIARVAGKLACRHGLGGELLLRSEKVKAPTETVALLADCLRALEAMGGDSAPVIASAQGLSVSDRPASVHPEFLTPPQVGALYGVSPDTVRGWIRSGVLQAVNIARGNRPRYRVTRDALRTFDANQRGRVVPTAPVQRRRRRTVDLPFTRYV
jgi:hypothetical protein